MLPAKLLRGYAAARSMTEAEARVEIESTLADVARTFSSFQFGPHERSDMAQQAALFGWQALCRDPDDPDRRGYDPARPLRNFLSRHIKNRLHNFKRDNFLRPEAPCSCCDPFDPPPVPCEAHERWAQRNGVKMALGRQALGNNPELAPVDDRPDREEGEAEAFVKEVDAFVDRSFKPSMRADYLRMKQGASLPKARRDAVRKRIRGAFADALD